MHPHNCSILSECQECLFLCQWSLFDPTVALIALEMSLLHSFLYGMDMWENQPVLLIQCDQCLKIYLKQVKEILLIKLHFLNT